MRGSVSKQRITNRKIARMSKDINSMLCEIDFLKTEIQLLKSELSNSEKGQNEGISLNNGRFGLDFINDDSYDIPKFELEKTFISHDSRDSYTNHHSRVIDYIKIDDVYSIREIIRYKYHIRHFKSQIEYDYLDEDGEYEVEHFDSKKLEPIHIAALFGAVNTLRYLLMIDGTQSSIKSEYYDYEPLHFASISGSVEAMKVLIEHGADINVKTDNGNPHDFKYGYTPLHEAANWGNIDAVKYLLSLGADATIENNRGQSPLFVAYGVNKDRIANMLESATMTG